MSFFEEVDALGIAQLHIERMQKLEEKESKALVRTYRRVRQSLRDRLDILSGETFTAQQLRGVLFQVDTALSAMGEGLKADVRQPAINAGEKGVNDLLSEIRRFSGQFEGAILPINLDAVIVATDNANFLINQYQASIDAYTAGVRQTLTQQITQSAIEQISLSQLVQRLSKFMIGEEWKLLRIGRTELHNIYNKGKLRGMGSVKEKFIPNLKKTLIHPMDKRTGEDSKQLAEKNPILDIDKPFKFVFNGKERIFMSPPDRPNDRSILIPFRQQWG